MMFNIVDGRCLLFVALICQLLATVRVSEGKTVQCGYDCSAPVPNAFGRNNFNTGGLAGFPLPSTKAFTSQSTLGICSSPQELTPFLQPQVVDFSSENEFYVVCPLDKTLNLVSVDPFLGSMTLKESVLIESSSAPIAFFVSGGRVAVSTGASISLFNGLTLELMFSTIIPTGKTAVGMPLVSFDSVVTTLSDDTVLKIPFSAPSSPETFTVGVTNSLKFNVVDAYDNLFFCSAQGLHKLSLTSGVVETLDLATQSLVCSNVVVTNKNMLMISATSTGGRSFKSALYEISSAPTFPTTLPVPLVTFEDTVSYLSRTAFYLNGVLTVKTAVATDKTVEVFTQTPDVNSEVEQTVVFETDGPVTNFLSLSTKAEPGFFVPNSANGLNFFLYEVTVIPPEAPADVYFSPLLFSNQAVVFMDTTGTAVLFGYCNRYKLGDEVPEDRACPFADLPDKDRLDPLLIIAATAGAALFLPLGTRLICRVTKSNRKKEDYETEHIPEEVEQ